MTGRASRPVQAVILAGGRGTRLRPLTDQVPKPMIPVAGRPFLDHLLALVKRQGFERVLLLLGYLPEVIQAHCGDGSRYGLRVDYAVTSPETQTLGRLRDAQDRLDDCFLLSYCDNYWPMQFDALWRTFLDHPAAVQVTAYANDDGYTRNNLLVDPDGTVRRYDRNRRDPDLNAVDIGFALVDTARIGPLPDDDLPFEHVMYPGLARERQLSAHLTHHRYYGIGSVSRLPSAERFFTRGPAVFLDRDGVLNKRPPQGRYVCSWNQFRWLDGAREGLRLLTRAGWTIVIVTNQAGVGRGMMPAAALVDIHARLLADAAAAGARIERIYHCPHAWDAGCGCRKPAPGMLFRAQRELDLDLSRAVFIGDDRRDAEAAAAAGCAFMPAGPDRPLLTVAQRLVAGTRGEGA